MTREAITQKRGEVYLIIGAGKKGNRRQGLANKYRVHAR